MNRIEIRGVIVPSEYDSDWTRQYIEKGIITPESSFRNALKKASTKEPLEIYINSPGGSIFSAYEMVNAVREWKTENKQPANIIIGAMAASAASIITIFVGSSVKAHRNAKMMFHGASTVTFGGKEAHEDEAALLGKINAEVQQTLIQKYKMDSDVVAEWFAEGRMGWLDAEEMLKAGIVSEIIPDDSEVIKFDPEVVKAIDAKGLDIAALLEESKNGNGKPVENSASNLKPKKPSGTDTENVREGKPADEKPKEENQEVSAEYQRGLADARVACELEHSKRLEAITAQLSKRDDLIRKLQSEKDKAEAALPALERKFASREIELQLQITKLNDAVKDANERHAKLIAGGLTFAPAAPESWEEVMASPDFDYSPAAKQHPQLIKEYNARMKRK